MNYVKFLEEVYGLHTLQTDFGFGTYKLSNCGNLRTFNIKDVFVEESARGQHKGFEIFDKMYEIAKQNECQVITVVVSKIALPHIQERTAHLCEKKGLEKYNEDSFFHYYKGSVK